MLLSIFLKRPHDGSIAGEGALQCAFTGNRLVVKPIQISVQLSLPGGDRSIGLLPTEVNGV